MTSEELRQLINKTIKEHNPQPQGYDDIDDDSGEMEITYEER